MKIAFITPTKDRPDDIRKMLNSYMVQTRRPGQVVIVDSSAEPVSDVVDEFPELKIDYKCLTEKPSAAGQRNGGIELLRDENAQFGMIHWLKEQGVQFSSKRFCVAAWMRKS